MKMPTRIYERLTPDERFRAFVEAAGRRDEEEVDRLNATCPMKIYRIEDPDYFLAKTNALIITLCSHLDAAKHAELAAFSMALLMLGDAKHEEMAVAGLSSFVRRYRAQTLGFERFCERIGVSPENMRKMTGCGSGPMTEMALRATEDTPEADPDPEEIGLIADQLMAIWRVGGVV